MARIFINSVKIWRSQWSHGHQLALALARQNFIYYFEPTRAADNPYSGLADLKHNYQLPNNIQLISSKRIFSRISFIYLFYNQWRSLMALWRLRNQITSYFSYNVYDLLALILSKFLGKKTVFLYIDEYDILTRWPRLRYLIKFLLICQLRLAGVVIVTAQKLKEKAMKHNKNVFYLPNAVAAEDLVLAKNLSQIKQKKLTIGFIGSLGKWVDADLIMAALERYPKINFDIYGDGAVYEKLKNFKQEKNKDNLKLPGRISHDDFYKTASQFDLAIIPFIKNEITDSVSPIKLFEYWLVGLPVIARKTRELEQYSQELLLYESAKDFFQYIDNLEKNRHIYDNFGRLGQQLVIKKYNWSNYADFFNRKIL